MEIPKVDLRAAVTASMLAHGCVVVAHGDDALGPDLRRALFDRALPEFFALPLDSKMRAAAAEGAAKEGYRGHINGMAWESIGINVAENGGSIRHPLAGGETIVSFANNMLKLVEMLETLVLEGLGVRAESVRTHLDQLRHSVRLSNYGVPPDTETSVSMQAHYDDTMNSVIVQHEVEGLEVCLGDGRWVAVPPEPGTFTFMAGEQLRVATNGRVPPCFHRVRTPSNREQFALLFGFRQKPGIEVRALDDLVDEEHPLAFDPLKHEYSDWRYSEEGFKVQDALKAFCGVGEGSSHGSNAAPCVSLTIRFEAIIPPIIKERVVVTRCSAPK